MTREMSCQTAVRQMALAFAYNLLANATTARAEGSQTPAPFRRRTLACFRMRFENCRLIFRS